MPRLRHVNIEAAPAPPQSHFSHAVTDGAYAFLSGQLAGDAGARPYRRGDIEDETRAAMDLLGEILGELGLDFGDVVRVNVYMTDLGGLECMNSVYIGYFDRARPPARTCVGVMELIGGGLIEIDCVARLRD